MEALKQAPAVPAVESIVILTPKAAEKVKEIMGREGKSGSALRLYVAGGGCSGFQYGLAFDEAKAEDTVVEQHGVRVLVDPASAPHLKGTHLDYVESFEGAGFKIENPNAARTCGCGSSFESKA
ncbi:MAG: iron-sulfur cluster insertion protein ErpA [Euryarchaeota archaeon]|nr:iron-sulfur cluster insertion protein ErpA [Euryarchaeota archaeon]